MENEEMYIREKIENRNPFTVPQGYFEQLTTQVMMNLPEKQKPTLIKHLQPLLYAAAFVGIAIFSATLFINRNEDTQDSVIATSTAIDSNYDDVADYAMVDNQDIYSYLLADM